MILFLFFIGHFIADFTLQTEYMALGKNKYNPIPNTNWYWPMIAHTCTHGLMVFIVTTIFLLLFSFLPIIVILNVSMVFCILEILAHFIIDCLKCKNIINYNMSKAIQI